MALLKRLRSADGHKPPIPTSARSPHSNPSPGAWRHRSWQSSKTWAPSAVPTLHSLAWEAPEGPSDEIPSCGATISGALGAKPSSSCSPAGTGRGSSLLQSLLCPQPIPKGKAPAAPWAGRAPAGPIQVFLTVPGKQPHSRAAPAAQQQQCCCSSHFPHILQPDGSEKALKLLLGPLLFLPSHPHPALSVRI